MQILKRELSASDQSGLSGAQSIFSNEFRDPANNSQVFDLATKPFLGRVSGTFERAISNYFNDEFRKFRGNLGGTSLGDAITSGNFLGGFLPGFGGN